MWVSSTLAVIISLISATIGKDLPEEFDRCKRNANLDKCLVDAVNNALVVLKDGYPDFGIAPLEPLHVKSLVIDSGSNSPVSLKQTFKNVKIRDLISTSKIIRYRTDLNKYLIVCDSKSKRIEVVGDYEISGRILLLPIVGKGKANLTLIDADIEHRLIGEPVYKNDTLYMILKEYRVDFKPKRVIMHFDNLFNDKILSENMNRFINDNWELVFNEVKGGYAKGFGDVFRDITNKLFGQVPMDKLFSR